MKHCKLPTNGDEDQSIDSILEDMADAHKTTTNTIREILSLASMELQNADSEHSFIMDGESADHFLLDHRFEYDYKAKKKRRMDSTSNPPGVIQSGSE